MSFRHTVLCCLLLPAVCGAEMAPITSVAAILSLRPAQFQERPTVKLRATLTAYNPADYFASIQQNGRGIYVGVNPQLVQPELRPGDTVEVYGIAVEGAYAPAIEPTQIVRVGVGHLPEPHSVKASDLYRDKWENVLVRIRGHITKIVWNPNSSRMTAELHLVSNGSRFRAIVRGASRQNSRYWVGSDVELVGVAGTETNGRRQKTGGSIHVTDPQSLSIVEYGHFNWNAERLPVESLLAFHSNTKLGDQVRIAGRVTYASGSRVFLQDQTGGVPVELALGEQVKPGDALEAQGRISLSDEGEYQLGEALVRAAAEIPQVAPQRIDPQSSTFYRRNAGRLVRFMCTVSGYEVMSSGFRVWFEIEHLMAYAQLAVPRGTEAGLPPLIPGDVVELTGVLELSAESVLARGMTLLLRSPADLRLVARRSWQQRFPWGRAAVFLLAVASAALAWVFLLQREVRRRTRELVRANRAKSEFVANMSHEIRTPINGILGMTQLALETPLTAEQYEYLSAANTSTEALLTVVNDILDFSKIDAGKLTIEAIPFRLRKVLHSSVRVLSADASAKGLELTCEVADHVPDRLIGDPGRLRQILLNLVSNALKFTESGEVAVSVDVEFAAGERCILRTEVRDTGIGIPPQKQKLIFDAFAQADTSTTRRFGGTGLGLTISRRLVQLMNGSIQVESQVGNGSSFSFTVDLGVERGSPAGEAEVSTGGVFRALRVLVVDDHAGSRRILQTLMAKWGIHAKTAVSGPEALSALENGEFDVVLIDKVMPPMSGFETIGEMRRRWPRRDPGVFLLTALTEKGDANLCREHRISGYLLKPVLAEELHAVLERSVQPSRENNPSRPDVASFVPRGRPEIPVRPLHVLIAEDNRVNQIFATKMLEKHGHRVTLAADGNQAVQAFERDEFDLILMDVQMPNKDGVEATGEIRRREAGLIAAHRRSKRTPIVALTAHAMRGDQDKCLHEGMDGYLSKPVRVADLLAVLANVADGAPVSPARLSS
ncbi:MAG: response regulator [Candidatus Solibacter sp.]